jgi:hypothetical protein
MRLGHRVGRLIFLACLTGQGFAALGQAPTAAGRPFVLAADADPKLISFQWARLINEEAFRRLGLTVEVVNIPLARRNALLADAIDGELSRTSAYADTHPDLVRVEESVMDYTFSIFAVQPGLQARTLDDLPPSILIEYRRGILVCENLLKKSIPPERLSTVANSEQGVRKLLAGRTDVFCDIDTFVDQVRRSGEVPDAGKLRKLFDIAAVPAYPYLYRKHAELAPRMAAVLKQMKAEGLMEAYRRQAEREAGAGPRP